jgi:chemotaxis protein methyltransferase CheR
MTCTDADFAYLRSVVVEQSSNVLDASRDYLFEPRLQRLLDSTGLKTLDSLVAALRRQPDSAMKRSVAEAMTVNETSFFRDRTPFDLLQFELLPPLIRQRESERRLRLWSAASSSGQEAYSLAMLLREHFPQLKDWQVEISGSDISVEVINRAQAGRYQRGEVNRGLPASYLLKYMRQTGDEWEVIPELKRVCRFYHRNLCDGPMLLEKYDGILLRNVMLYFSKEARRQLLVDMHSMLHPDGFLILGSSEQPDQLDHFQAVLTANTCYYRPLPSRESAP